MATGCPIDREPGELKRSAEFFALKAGAGASYGNLRDSNCAGLAWNGEEEFSISEDASPRKCMRHVVNYL